MGEKIKNNMFIILIAISYILKLGPDRLTFHLNRGTKNYGKRQK